MYKQIVRRLPKMSNIMYICEEGCENPLLNLNKKTCVCYSQKRFYVEKYCVHVFAVAHSDLGFVVKIEK